MRLGFNSYGSLGRDFLSSVAIKNGFCSFDCYVFFSSNGFNDSLCGFFGFFG
jgi:hypothetical protein